MTPSTMVERGESGYRTPMHEASKNAEQTERQQIDCIRLGDNTSTRSHSRTGPVLRQQRRVGSVDIAISVGVTSTVGLSGIGR